MQVARRLTVALLAIASGEAAGPASWRRVRGEFIDQHHACGEQRSGSNTKVLSRTVSTLCWPMMSAPAKDAVGALTPQAHASERHSERRAPPAVARLRAHGTRMVIATRPSSRNRRSSS